jgi:hypothetical protein
MTHQADSASAAPIPRWPALVLVAVIFACSVYANLALAVTNPEYYRFFPPFKAYVNAAKQNGFMQGEYYRIARALAAGEGFANPFVQPTGPTAWQAPVYPLFIASLLWLFDGNLDVMTAGRVFVQVYVLIGTGLLILALVRKTTSRSGAGVALVVYLGVLVWNFEACFQRTQDSCFVLLALDLIIMGLCWWQPLRGWKSACVWGLFGGFCAMITPVVGFTWGILSLGSGVRDRSLPGLSVALLCCGLALTPWTIRNYLVFGRLIPMKSNLAFELFQSQCLERDGLLTGFRMHPGNLENAEGREYLRLGEVAYMDRKWEQFRRSVAADPLDFGDRVASRYLAATLWYAPFGGPGRPWILWLKRGTHPLPFLALLFLVFTCFGKPLHRAQWIVMGIYAVYLLPYIAVSYYERYAQPLWGVKALLAIWAVDRMLSIVDWKQLPMLGRSASIPVVQSPV